MEHLNQALKLFRTYSDGQLFRYKEVVGRLLSIEDESIEVELDKKGKPVKFIKTPWMVPVWSLGLTACNQIIKERGL